MNKPLLSICIPTYNRAPYLKELLDSIVCQFNDPEIYNQVEVIISDNASEDNTTEMVAEYQRKYKNIRYSRNYENLGAVKNGLILFELQIGKYIWLIGDDDAVSSDSIKYLISKIEKNNYSAVLMNFDQGEYDNLKIKPYTNSLHLKEDKEYADYRDFFKGEDFKNFHGINFLSALVYNSALLKENTDRFGEFFDTCYLQSHIFLILGTNGNILRIAKPLVIWRAFSGGGKRRYDEWVRNDEQIKHDFNGFIEHARRLGYIFDESKRLKLNSINVPKKLILGFLKKFKLLKYVKAIRRIPRLVKYYISGYSKNK